jgi:hypothetical protein
VFFGRFIAVLRMQLCLLAQIACRRLAFSSSTSPGASAGRVSSASVLTQSERKSIRFLEC